MTNNDYQQIRPWLEGVLTAEGLPCKFEEANDSKKKFQLYLDLIVNDPQAYDDLQRELTLEAQPIYVPSH